MTGFSNGSNQNHVDGQRSFLPPEWRNPKSLAIAALVSGIAAFLIGFVPFIAILIFGLGAVGLGGYVLYKKQSKNLALGAMVVGAVGILFTPLTLGVSAFGVFASSGTSVAEEPDEQSDPNLVMPQVVGLALSLAKSDIARTGFEGEIEIIGGGLFGIANEDRWEVCEQLPAAGENLDVEPRLTVERNCGGEESDPVESASAKPQATEEPKKEQAPKTAVPTKTVEPKQEDESKTEVESPATTASSADVVEAKFLEHLSVSIDSMCDDYYTHWACFYDGVEGDSSMLQINLTTDGGWSDSDLDQMAQSAGIHWFNFIGCDYPELGTIIVTINGLDHNVFRSSMRISC